MAKSHLKLVATTGNIPTVRTPRRGRNTEYRTREHLTENEVKRLIEATASHRDATMILLAFRHGLRAEQVDFEMGVLHVRRAKAGTPSTHPLTGRELRALRRLQRETGPSTHLFMSERKAPISTDGFQKLVERLSARQVTSGGRKECRNPRKEKGLSRYRAPVSQNASPQSAHTLKANITHPKSPRARIPHHRTPRLGCSSESRSSLPKSRRCSSYQATESFLDIIAFYPARDTKGTNFLYQPHFPPL